MIKKFTLAAAFTLVISAAFGQAARHTTPTTAGTGTDTLLYQNFDYTSFTFSTAMPGGTGMDTAWYAYDNAGLSDGSGGTTPRPGNWFLSGTMWSGDSTLHHAVMASNSWFSPAGTADDWLITPSIYISDTTAKFSWTSAARQMPRYLDGYEIRVSAASTNALTNFKDTLFTAAENTGFIAGAGHMDSVYAGYTFSKGYVQGMNGTYAACSVPHCDSARLIGELEPHMVSLKKYIGKTIFIAVHHNSTDDNLISVDNLCVTGTGVMGINEQIQHMVVNVFPNPATTEFQLSYDLPSSSNVIVNMYDIRGQLVKAESKGLQTAGMQTCTLNVSDLAHGTYTLMLQTSAGKSAVKVLVK
jgi:hypothetical protein